MRPLGRFLLSVILWLPICFGVWYFTSILFTTPLAWIVDTIMTRLFPSIIEHIQQHGNELTVITKLTVPAPNSNAGVLGDILFNINPLTYGYCIPLYTALVFAAPEDDTKKFGYWIIGILILFAVQAFGVATDVLKILMLLSEDARTQLGFAPWGYELVAIGYQFGYLILPPVAPIVIWFGQFQTTLAVLIENPTAAETAK